MGLTYGYNISYSINFLVQNLVFFLTFFEVVVLSQQDLVKEVKNLQSFGKDQSKKNRHH